MENVRLAKLFPVIRAQEAKMEGMRQVIQKEYARGREKMVQYAKQAQKQAAEKRSLKHDFTIETYGDSAPDSVFVDFVAVVKDDRTGWELQRFPTRYAMELGRQARRNTVERILDLIV
ncbi:MAG: hypothetical protein GX971_14895 [Firmicutes bacterium]|jgi:hypothetical protein|nr:hypothetical protein [Bacillota bacterium]